MITLRQLSEQVIIALSGGDKSRESEIQFPDVILNLKQTLASLVKMSLYENIKMDDSHDVAFPYIFPVRKIPVQYDPTFKECYSILPEIPLQIPGNRGIHEVKPNSTNCKPFNLILAGQYHMIKNIIQDEVVCWPKHNRLIYHKDIRKDTMTVEVDFILVVPEALGFDDAFFLPPDVQDASVQEVIKRMSPVVPQDKVNDNNKQV